LRRKVINSIALLLLLIPPLLILEEEGMRLFYRSPTRQLLFLGKGLGAVGYCAMAIAILFSTRWHWIDRAFGGLDKVYRSHHLFGMIGFCFVVVHPLVLSLKRSGEIRWWLVEHMFRFHSRWDITFGAIAYWLFILLIGLMLLRLFPYHIWKRSHRLLDLVFLLASIHTLGTANRHEIPLLKGYLLLFTLVGLYAIGWRLFTWLRGGKYRYELTSINHLTSEVVTIDLKPVTERMPVRPGQFAYFSMHHPQLSRESHPYTPIHFGDDGSLRLLVKAAGDYTWNLYRQLSLPAFATTDGAYGQFHYSHGGRRQIWIAGGVGIAPFLCWIDQLDEGARPAEIHLYYCYHSSEESSCFAELCEKSRALSGFKVSLRCTQEEGHLKASDVEMESGFRGVDVFLCGPRRMINDLHPQLRALGVPSRRLHWEDFEMNYAKSVFMLD
jgi:predicted ferric reductase